MNVFDRLIYSYSVAAARSQLCPATEVWQTADACWTSQQAPLRHIKGMTSSPLASVCGLAPIYGYLYIQLRFKKYHACVLVFVPSVLCAASRIALIVSLCSALSVPLHHVLWLVPSVSHQCLAWL